MGVEDGNNTISESERMLPFPMVVLGSIFLAFIFIFCCRGSQATDDFVRVAGGWTAVPTSEERAVAAGGGGGIEDDLEDGHDRARSVSKRYRELRANGKPPPEAMALAEKEFAVKNIGSGGGGGGGGGNIGGKSNPMKQLSAEELPLPLPLPPPSAAATPAVAVAAAAAPSAAPFPSQAPPQPMNMNPSSPSSSSPRVKMSAEEVKELRVQEKKLVRCRSLREQGYDAAQALFLSDLPRNQQESNAADQYRWYIIQDDVQNCVYFWDGDSQVRWDKPVQFVWRLVVVSPTTTSSGSGAGSGGGGGSRRRAGEAREWEFGQGQWNQHGSVGLPPPPPQSPRPSSKSSPRHATISRRNSVGGGGSSGGSRSKERRIGSRNSSMRDWPATKATTANAASSKSPKTPTKKLRRSSSAHYPDSSSSSSSTAAAAAAAMAYSSASSSSSSSDSPSSWSSSSSWGSSDRDGAVTSPVQRGRLPVRKSSKPRNSPGGFGSSGGAKTRNQPLKKGGGSNRPSRARSQSMPRTSNGSVAGSSGSSGYGGGNGVSNKNGRPSQSAPRPMTTPGGAKTMAKNRAGGGNGEKRRTGRSHSMPPTGRSAESSSSSSSSSSSRSWMNWLVGGKRMASTPPPVVDLPPPPTDKNGLTFAEYMAKRTRGKRKSSKTGGSSQNHGNRSRSVGETPGTSKDTMLRKSSSSPSFKGRSPNQKQKLTPELRRLKAARKAKANRDNFIQRQAEEAAAASSSYYAAEFQFND